MSSELLSIEAIGLTKPNSYPNVEKLTYQPLKLRSTDIDIKIIACGICGADPHFARGDWGGPILPIVPGHEVVGYIVNKGIDVKDEDFKIGDRVGVGAAADCCGNCYRCNHQFENTCRKSVFTYGNAIEMPYRQGGYASHIRVSSKFVFHIPENISSEHAAPLLCGGMTSLSPLLVTNVKEGMDVAICGIGGIGHMGIMFAKALGANVTAISSSDSKKKLAMELGAHNFISMAKPNFADEHPDEFDVIVHTGSFVNNELISNLIKMLRPNGRLQLISGPDEKPLALNPFELIMSNASIGGVVAGSPSQIRKMLELASKHNITPMVELLDINEENITKAWNRVDKNDVKFRFVLTGYDKYFK